MKAFVKQNTESNEFVLMEVPIPNIDAHEILVEVKAIGVGIQDGYFFPQNMNFPYPIGIEGAGIIKKVGEEVADFQVGDHVSFISVLEPKGGVYAEYAVLGQKSVIVQIPTGMSFIQAAAIPVAGNTMAKVIKALQLKPNETLFIAGASGANGTIAIQLAKELGCIVSSSASEVNHEYMKALGVTKAVDYHDPNWMRQILDAFPGGVDAAIAIQPQTSASSMGIVKEGGKIISVSGDQFMTERHITAVFFPYQMDVKNALIDIMHKIVSGEMKLFIEKVYDFEEALLALEKVRTRRARGKSVIVITDKKGNEFD